MIWIFPLLGLQLETKFGRISWRLLNGHFPGNSPLAGVFSGGRVGLGYSCTRDLLDVVKSRSARQLEAVSGGLGDEAMQLQE